MAYRKIEKKKPIKRVLQDTTTKNRTFIQNGATAHIAIPCWYQEIKHPQHTHIHDREWHDHIGWPTPDNPDGSSQAAYHLRHHAPYVYNSTEAGWRNHGRYLNMSNLVPIHLTKEGYESVDIAFVDPPAGLDAEGFIDPDSDWIVRFSITSMCDRAINEDVEVEYSVFVNGTINEKKRRDVVAHGTLKILAGPVI